jgi:centrosomal protein CEP104
VYFSGEDSEYPADELNVHSPHTKGWQSPRFCEYPQEIGFQLVSGTARLSQVQILSHQSKIASKIEIFIGNGLDYNSAQYKRLGYLSLDDNERSSYQARELKTVYLDYSGNFVRLLIHQCHTNKYNLFNQVGIVAVNLLSGDDLNAEGLTDLSAGKSKNLGGYSAQSKSIPSKNTTLNDLSIDMNLDPQTAAKLRVLSEAKNRAVENEDYAMAKQVKS